MVPEEIGTTATVSAAPPVIASATESTAAHKARATWHHNHKYASTDSEKKQDDEKRVQEKDKEKPKISGGGWRFTLAHPFSAFHRAHPSSVPEPGAGAEGAKDFPEDVEREAARAGSYFGGIHSTSSFAPARGGGGGVLSALLALYERPGTGMQSVPQTPDVGVYSTNMRGEERRKRRSWARPRSGRRSESRGRSVELDREREKRAFEQESTRLPSPPPPSFARSSVNSNFAASASAPDVRATSVTAPRLAALVNASDDTASPSPGSFGAPTTASSSSSSSPRARLRALPKLTLPPLPHLPNKLTDKILPDRRPPGTRSAAGVFGALVAGAGGALGGPAAPKAVALAPDPERSGWQLARWSVEERAPKAGTAGGHKRGKSEGVNALKLDDGGPGQTRASAVPKRPGFARAQSAPIVPTFSNEGPTPPDSGLSPESTTVPLAAPPLFASESAPIVPGYSAGAMGSEESSVATTPGSTTPFLFGRGAASRSQGLRPGAGLENGGESGRESKRVSMVYSDDATLALSRVGTGASNIPLSLMPTNMTGMTNMSTMTTDTSASGTQTPGGTRRKLNLKDIIRPRAPGWATPTFQFRGTDDKYGESVPGTPDTGSDGLLVNGEKDWMEQEKLEQRRRAQEEKRRRKRKKAEIYVSELYDSKEDEILIICPDYAPRRSNPSTSRIYPQACARAHDVRRADPPPLCTALRNRARA